MHLVLVETSGNQSYIFSTNKLRENVGASELTSRVGTQFVLEAVRDLGGPDLWSETPRDARNALRDASRNRPVDNSNPVEVVLAVSGKALMLVRDEQLGRKIVSLVTRRALCKAPGVDVRGVVGRALDLERDAIHDAIRDVHRELERVRSKLPGPSSRFQRLPFVAECATSGLPAARCVTEKDGFSSGEAGPRSTQSLAKHERRDDFGKRLNNILKTHGVDDAIPFSTAGFDDLECDWLAIMHADGNGLGQIFLNFDKVLGIDKFDARTYIDKLRRFSLGLDECTERAFCESLKVLEPKRGVKPIVPLVLGGDDLTVVCDGRQALRFAERFIVRFEEETRSHRDVFPIQSGGITSCAGVAIVKPHFPFFAAYELAEELLRSAKHEKPNSAIDFHILYDASGADLSRIRGELTLDHDTRLVARPYLVKDDAERPRRGWSTLTEMVAAIRKSGPDNRRELPNSMLHELRESLFLGRDAAEARLALVLDRYRDGFKGLLADGKLFWKDEKCDCYVTGLLDALDVVEFWEGTK